MHLTVFWCFLLGAVNWYTFLCVRGKNYNIYFENFRGKRTKRSRPGGRHELVQN